MKKPLASLSFLLGLIVALSVPVQSYNAGSIEINEWHKLTPSPLAAGGHHHHIEINYPSSEELISDIIEVPPSNFLALNWEEIIPESGAAEIEIRFMDEYGNWSEFADFHEDHHSPNHHDATQKWGEFYKEENIIAVQYKASLSTFEGAESPSVKVNKLHYDSTEKNYRKAPLQKLVTSLSRRNRRLTFNNVKIIPRAEWIQNPEVAYLNLPLSEEEMERRAEIDWYDEERANVQYVDFDDHGGEFIWPLQYQPIDDIDTIVIHHTASNTHRSNSLMAANTIYNYHARTRGWGDVGYHYLIGADGKIYEGRQGGPEVIGGHVAQQNGGKIGIALLGDYHEGSRIPAPVAESLSALAYDLAEHYNIDLSRNLVGHSDLDATACPGVYTQPYVEELADFLHDLSRESFVNDIEEQFMVISPGSSKDFVLKVPNKTTSTWLDPYIRVKGNQQNATLTMKKAPSSVTPNRSGLFTVSLQAERVRSLENLTLEVYSGGRAVERFPFGVFILQPFGSSTEIATGSNRGNTVTSSNNSIRTQPLNPNVAPTQASAEVVAGDSGDITIKSGQRKTAFILIRNNTNRTWSRDDLSLKVSNQAGITLKPILTPLREIRPGIQTRYYFEVAATGEPGDYTVKVQPTLSGRSLTGVDHEMKVIIEGLPSEENKDMENPIRILLTPDNEVGNPLITANTSFSLFNGERYMREFPANTKLRITPEGNKFTIRSGLTTWQVEGPLRFVPSGDGFTRILSMEQRPAWNPDINDNDFKGIVEVRRHNMETILINELSLNDYLKGMAEISGDTHPEKAKVMSILARSYAYYYMTHSEKFIGEPYNLDDSPERSQKYLGHGFTRRSNAIVEAVNSTKGQVVSYDGDVVKTPYFTQTNGARTLSAEEVWGWTHTPYLISVDDSHCAATERLGHGVGLSGCGAEAFAQQGKTYQEIIDYYYPGTTLMTIE